MIATLCGFLLIVPSSDLQEIMGRIALASLVEVYCDGYRSREHVLFEIDDFTSFVRVVCLEDLFDRLVKTFRVVGEDLLEDGSLLLRGIVFKVISDAFFSF
jgi:hypothetical protein